MSDNRVFVKSSAFKLRNFLWKLEDKELKNKYKEY